MFSIEDWAKSVLAEEERRLNHKGPLSPEELARWEKSFKRAKSLMKNGVRLFVVLMPFVLYYFITRGAFGMGPIAFFKSHPAAWGVILPVWFSMRISSVGYLSLREILKEFVKKSKIQEAANALQDASLGRLSPYPNFVVFISSESLLSFERRYVKFYKEQRKRQNKIRYLEQEMKKTEKRIERLEHEKKLMEKSIAQALLLITDERDLARYETRFRKAKDMNAVRALVTEIENKSNERESVIKRQSAKVDGLLELLLRDASENGLCSTAEELVSEIKKSPYIREKIDCLKQAITAQRAFNQKIELEKLSRCATPTTVSEKN